MRFHFKTMLAWSLALGCTVKDGGSDTTAGSEDGSSGGSSGGGSTGGGSTGDGPTGGGTTDGTTGVASSATETADEASADGSDDEAGEESDSDSDTASGGPTGSCFPGEIELVDVVVEVTKNRAFGEDVPAVFDAGQGSYACVSVTEERVRLKIAFAPIDHSYLFLEVYDGVRTYDLATDPAPPGTGDPGLIELGYNLDIGDATTASFGTINQAATGTVDVLALPIDGDTNLEFTAVGEFAQPDGWQFDLHVTGSAP